MSYVKEALLQKEKELASIIARTAEAIKKSPEGRLRISPHGNGYQFYHCLPSLESEARNRTGKYIKKDNLQLAHQLGQKDYDEKVLVKAEKELADIRKMLKNYQPEELQDIYSRMNPARKEIVKPRIITDEMYVKDWSEVQYSRKLFAEGTAEICSNRGERVRSKSEKIIADMLDAEGIPYRYEYPVVIRGMGKVHPDFTVLNVRRRRELYWEHLGMMDYDEYCERALYKLECYMKSGIFPGERLVITHETSKRPLETELIRKVIKTYFM